MNASERFKRQLQVAEDRGDVLAQVTLGVAIAALDEHEGHDERYQTDCSYCERDMEEAGRYWAAVFRREGRPESIAIEPERDYDFIRDEARGK